MRAKVRQLLDLLQHHDKDERFMAISDLTDYLRESLSQIQQPVVDGVVAMLSSDSSCDNQAMAVKCISVLVPRLSAAQCLQVVSSLFEAIPRVDVDLFLIGMKTVLFSSTSPQSIALDVLTRSITKYDSSYSLLLLIESLPYSKGSPSVYSLYPALVSLLLPLLHNSVTSRNASVAIGLISVDVDEAIFSAVMTQVIEHRHVYAIGCISKNAPLRVEPHLERIMTLLEACWDKNPAHSDEIKMALEVCEILLEKVSHMQPYYKLILSVSSKYLVHDPNCSGISLDTNASGLEGDDTWDDGEDEEYEGIEEIGDDESWKLRSVSVRVLNCMPYDNTVLALLVDRLGIERDISVLSTVVDALSAMFSSDTTAGSTEIYSTALCRLLELSSKTLSIIHCLISLVHGRAQLIDTSLHCDMLLELGLNHSTLLLHALVFEYSFTLSSIHLSSFLASCDYNDSNALEILTYLIPQYDTQQSTVLYNSICARLDTTADTSALLHTLVELVRHHKMSQPPIVPVVCRYSHITSGFHYVQLLLELSTQLTDDSLSLILDKLLSACTVESISILRSLLDTHGERISVAAFSTILNTCTPLISRDLGNVCCIVSCSSKFPHGVEALSNASRDIVSLLMSLVKSLGTEDVEVLEYVVDSFQCMLCCVPCDFIVNSIMELVCECVPEVLSQCIAGVVLSASDDTQASIQLLRSYLVNPSFNVRTKQVALLCLGKIGVHVPLQSTSIYQYLLDYKLQPEMCNAVSSAIGGITYGNLQVEMPILLKCLVEDPSVHLLTALYTTLVSGKSTNLQSHIPEVTTAINTLLLTCSSSQILPLAQCIGMLVSLDSSIYTLLQELVISNNPHHKCIAITALQYSPFTTSEALEPFLTLALDTDLDVKRHALTTINTLLRSSSNVLVPTLGHILDTLVVPHTIVDTSLIHTVDYGPYQKQVDTGLPLRRSAYVCIESTASTHPSYCSAILDVLVRGITDTSADIQDIVLSTIQLLCDEESVPLVPEFLEMISAPILLQFKGLLRSIRSGDARAMDVAKHALRTLAQLQSLPGAQEVPQFTAMSSRIKLTPALSQLME